MHKKQYFILEFPPHVRGMAGNAIYHCSGHLEETACDESEWWKTNGEKDERMEQRNGQSVVMDKGKQILILGVRGAFGGGDFHCVQTNFIWWQTENTAEYFRNSIHDHYNAIDSSLKDGHNF